eukprot:scaffold20057_cov61-Phaeocystis_antarctica.AAC.7
MVEDLDLQVRWQLVGDALHVDTLVLGEGRLDMLPHAALERGGHRVRAKELVHILHDAAIARAGGVDTRDHLRDVAEDGGVHHRPEEEDDQCVRSLEVRRRHVGRLDEALTALVGGQALEGGHDREGPVERADVQFACGESRALLLRRLPQPHTVGVLAVLGGERLTPLHQRRDADGVPHQAHLDVCGEGIDEHHAQDAQQVTHAALHRLDMDGRELGETQQLWRRGGAV